MSTSSSTNPINSDAPEIADLAFALAALPSRSAGAHKWGVGGLVIIAGGPGYIGAAALAAMAAGRCGAGIVNLALPRGAMGAVASLVPEAAFIPLTEGDDAASSKRTTDAIRPRLEKSRAMVVGPGLGEDDYAASLLSAVFGMAPAHRQSTIGFQRTAPNSPDASAGDSLLSGDQQIVVDADALNWLAGLERWWERIPKGRLVLTPHVGEMAKLRGVSSAEVTADPAGIAAAAAREWGQTVVLKGGPTLATDGKRVVASGESPPSLATAGTGDVLAGAIGAFLAQGLAPLDAAGLAMYVGCRAALRLQAEVGVLGLVAGDLPFAMAQELAVLERS